MPHINPYQPSNELLDSEAVKKLNRLETIVDMVDTPAVCWRTVLAITLSGAAFGGLLVAFFVISVLAAMMGSSNGGSEIGETALAIPLGMLVGGGLAGIAALPVVFCVAAISRIINWSSTWNRVSIRRFSLLCGFLSGLLSVAVPMQFRVPEMLLGVVPGAFGAIFTSLVNRWLMRQVYLDAELIPLPIEPDKN